MAEGYRLAALDIVHRRDAESTARQKRRNEEILEKMDREITIRTAAGTVC